MKPGANKPADLRTPPWSGDDDRSSDFSDQHGQTLHEQLIEQLELAKLSAIDMAIARVITDAITDDGYLNDSLEDIRLSLLPEIDATAADVERVLHAVQSLEPAGVGARSLGECIALQLRQLHPDTPARDVAIRVALEHLDLVAGQQLVLLRRQLRCSEGDLEMALALVRSCHPRPGAAVNPAQRGNTSFRMFSCAAPTTAGSSRSIRPPVPAGPGEQHLCEFESPAPRIMPCCALSCRRLAG